MTGSSILKFHYLSPVKSTMTDEVKYCLITESLSLRLGFKTETVQIYEHLSKYTIINYSQNLSENDHFVKRAGEKFLKLC